MICTLGFQPPRIQKYLSPFISLRASRSIARVGEFPREISTFVKLYFYCLLFAITFSMCTLSCGSSPQSAVPSATSGQSSGASSDLAPSTGTSSASNTGGNPSSTPTSATTAPPNNGIPVSASTFSNLHQKSGWTGYALLPSDYNICSSCTSKGPGTTWSLAQGVVTPSVSGNSTEFTIGGKQVYSDVLWNKHLIGDFSSEGLPDVDHSIATNLHNFIYDVYFYGDDIQESQAVEFDINQFVNGQSFIWGHECRITGGNEWDIWDDIGQKWHPTGIPCHPLNKAWNHLTLQVQRTSDEHLLFQSITLNGETHTLNYYESPTSTNWRGVTLNYQQDGNYQQQQYSIWLDKLTFTYW